MEFAQYGEEDIGEMKKQLLESCKIGQGPYGEIRHSGIGDGESEDSGAQIIARKRKRRGIGGFGREHHFCLRDLILALSLCHNVTPVYPDEDDR